MPRTRLLRAIKVCPICGEGYDAFKARDARGRYCSPGCLLEARRRQRAGMPDDMTLAADPAPSSIVADGGDQERRPA